MNESKRCPSCGMAYDDDNLIVCLGCGAELHTLPTGDNKKYNLISAYKAMFTKFFDFSSRSSRGEYWWAYLANAIVVLFFALALVGIDHLAAVNLTASGDVRQVYKTAFDIVNYASAVYGFVILIPQLALIVRRLHDTGRSAVMALLLFAAPIGSAILMILLAMKGNRGANRFGQEP
ncbi:MAG: DUF805 domain-containing protein [Clostridia bacterium]|nr:DUF805 domain-containing protein [Clostridia bacterium]